VEEKYGKSKALDGGDDTDDSEAGVEEDDAGQLATEILDQEISATLQALRSKDPRIYDSNVKFFDDADEPDAPTTNGAKKEDSMTLRQYHTKNLLEGNFGGDEEEAPPKTYAQEQEEARQNLVKELHTGGSDEEEDDFLVAKSKSVPEPSKKPTVKITAEDVVKADRDPENFLSNYLASRAWVPKGDARFQPIESDDEDEDAAADDFEHSYNMYFEDTNGANEKLVTYARDAVAKATVRRDAQSVRRQAREAARAKREAERQEREDDLARLRKLKIEEMEQKVNKIRETGGLKGRDFNVAEWKEVLEAEWSDDKWDKEMQTRFGDAYYNDGEAGSESDAGPSKKKKPKKPKFDDDIDIKDLVPDFDDEEVVKPKFTLSSDEDEAEGEDEDDEDGTKSKKSSKKRKQERADAKSASRRDRRLIENLVDDNLQYETALASSRSMAPSRFRYRETSPTVFGMTARDILLADDKQLNEFAGLKKLATFRDPEKKKKDKKQLSKKARLRKWRSETFGDPDGPKGGFEVLVGEEEGYPSRAENGRAKDGDVNIKEGEGKKKKRSRKGKGKAVDA